MLTILFSVMALASVPPPDIVHRMLERIENDTVNSRSLTYIQERTEYETRNGNDRLKKIESRSVRGTGTGFLKRLNMRNGKPVINAKEEPLDTDMVSSTSKYDFVPVMAQTVAVDGYDCWQVRFTPRIGLRDTSDDDAILNHVEGTAYVDARNYLVRAIHATLNKPFRRGFLGAGRIVSVTMDTRQMEWDDKKHVGVQATAVIRIQYTVIGDTFMRIEYLNTNHRWQP